jgi:uncharacterized membrane protein
MQNADETAHAFRADQISRFGLLGVRIPDGEFGGPIDTGLQGVHDATAALPGHPDQKVTRAMYTTRPWGTLAPAGFPNTAINAPMFYAPAALAAALARAAGVALPHGLVLMRAATGAATICLAAAAIALSGEAAIFLFAILLLPMSLAVSAAISHDGPMLACAALAAALYIQLRNPDLPRRGLAYFVFCLLLTAIGMSRVPYAAFALLAAVAPVRRSWRLFAVPVIIACALVWNARSASYCPLPIRPDGIVAPGAQLSSLVLHFWRFPMLMLRTFTADDWPIASSFIGELGWLDVPLPTLYRRLAWGILLAATIAAGLPRRLTRPAAGALIEAGSILAAVCGVAIVEYMSWTVVGAPLIDGLQGRYFLVPACFIAVLLARLPAGPAWPRWPVLLFPIISIAVTVHAIILRYYL